MRVAIYGASGTGKTTVAKMIKQEFGLPFNPVGSRTVAKEMGFDNPYDVDAAGKRAEFQWKLVESKVAWERAHEQFVTDRTTLDNLAYTMLHDIYAASDDMFIAACRAGFVRYTHLIFCPTSVFCSLDDPHRVQNINYQRLYEVLLKALILHAVTEDKLMTDIRVVHAATVGERSNWVRNFKNLLQAHG